MATVNTSEKPPKGKLDRAGLTKILQIFRYVLPYKLEIAVALVLLLLSSGAFLAIPKLLGDLVDVAMSDNTGWSLSIRDTALLTMGAAFLMGLVSFFQTILIVRVSEKTVADIRTQVYNKLVSLPMRFFDKNRVGELVSRLTADITQMQEMLSWAFIQVLRQVIMFIGGAVIIMYTSYQLGLVMMSTFPVIIIIAFIMGRMIKRFSKRRQEALAKANVIVDESFQAIQTVKAYTNEKYEAGRYRKHIMDVVRIGLATGRFRGALGSFVIFGLIGGIILVFWVGSNMISRGVLTPGELVSFITLTMIVGAAVASLGDLYTRLQKTAGAADRVMEMLAETSEVDFTRPSADLQLEGNIAFENVRFHYPTRPETEVLKGINFSIPKGEKTAIVGHSGSGKSTIIKLILGFYQTTDGTIRFDNKAISDLPLADLRRNIGIVPQEVILFGGSIRDNIAYAKPDAIEEEIIEAARQANAFDFIESFPEGLDTLVGERGVQLSGGQKQRIAIARVILKDPRILILDEATSSLDAESEKLVQDALELLMENRTNIIIAHRLSTIRNANRIIVIDKGRIAESGSHDDLLALDGGIYNNLLKLQYEVA